MAEKLESAFLADMAERPEDMGLRLIFADWLEDHGDPDRAELIRLQCGPDREDAETHLRASVLFRTHQQLWEAPFQALGAEVFFRYGFPHFLKVSLQQLADHLDLLALAPEWHLALTRDDNYATSQADLCARLGSASCASRIRGLSFAWAGFDPDEVAAVLTPVVTRAVRELRFGDEDHKRQTLDMVLGLPDFQPHILGFGGDSYEGVGDEGCQVIAGAPQLASLRGLELPNNEIGPDGAAALASSPHIHGLRELDLAGGSNSPNRIGTEGARHLARSSNFVHLQSLDLVFNFIQDDGLAALAVSPQLPALRSLNIPGNLVTDEGLRALARSSGMPALSWLNVCGSQGGEGITAAGIQELVASPRMSRLTGLKLAGHPIGDAGAAALASAPAAASLRELRLTSCGISREGFVRILESPHLAGVQDIAIYGNPLTPEEISDLKARYGDRVK